MSRSAQSCSSCSTVSRSRRNSAIRASSTGTRFEAGRIAPSTRTRGTAPIDSARSVPRPSTTVFRAPASASCISTTENRNRSRCSAFRRLRIGTGRSDGTACVHTDPPARPPVCSSRDSSWRSTSSPRSSRCAASRGSCSRRTIPRTRSASLAGTAPALVFGAVVVLGAFLVLAEGLIARSGRLCDPARVGRGRNDRQHPRPHPARRGS